MNNLGKKLGEYLRTFQPYFFCSKKKYVNLQRFETEGTRCTPCTRCAASALGALGALGAHTVRSHWSQPQWKEKTGKTSPSEERPQGTPFRARIPSKTEDEGTFVLKNGAHVWYHLEWTPGLNTYRKKNDIPTSSINWKDIVQLAQDQSSIQDHLSSNYWTVGTIQQRWPLDSPPAQLQLWVPQFRPVASRSISCVWWYESKTVDWVLNAICKRLQKDQPWLRGLLTKSQSNPLATQITAIVLPCFRLL
jgi:hypothetical protein